MQLHNLLSSLLLIFCTIGGASAQAPSVVTTVTIQAAAPSTVPDYTSTPVFTSAVLSSSNFYRNEHAAVPLVWNDSLASFASNYVSTDSCVFQHSGGPNGENIAEGYPNATATVQAWGNERAEYDFSDPGFSEATGHFTQLVWKATKTVGCGRAYCGDTQGWFVVCEYWPRGNVIGEFGDNVESQVSGAVTSAAPAAPTSTCVQGGVCNKASAMKTPSKILWAITLGVILQI